MRVSIVRGPFVGLSITVARGVGERHRVRLTHASRRVTRATIVMRRINVSPVDGEGKRPENIFHYEPRNGKLLSMRRYSSGQTCRKPLKFRPGADSNQTNESGGPNI